MKIRLSYTVPAADRKQIAEWYAMGANRLISDYVAEKQLKVCDVKVASSLLRMHNA